MKRQIDNMELLSPALSLPHPMDSAGALKARRRTTHCLFTFSIDDGHPSDLKMADLLSKHNMNGTFFVPIRNREGHAVLSHQQLRELATRFEIGSHTYDHCYLKNITLAEARFQIEEGKKCLEDVLGATVPGFCYPGGKYRQQHVDIVKSAGFRFARSSANLYFDSGSNVFEMRTTIQFYPHSNFTYLRNFIRSGNWEARHDALRLALMKKNWIERMFSLFDWAVKNGMPFHLWAHSWEVDELNAWSELDQFLAHVCSRIPVEQRLTIEQLAARF